MKAVLYWLKAMIFEFFALLGVLVLRLIPLPHTPKGSARPILLVHGYCNHSSVWHLHKKRLEALHLGSIYTINLGHPFKSIGYYAAKVKAKAEEIAQQTKRSDLILIGHSMGGIVSCWYATQLAPPGTVTDVITIASPLAGTPMANFAIGPNATEMRRDSELLKELRQAISRASQIRFYHIATQTDQLVLPGASAIIEDNPHMIFKDIGHASMLYSRRVVRQIERWLTRSKPDCP